MNLVKRLFENRRVVLASRSPRRKQLLQQVGLEFDIDVPDIDEEAFGRGLPPDQVALELARRKAEAIAPKHREAFIIAADTIVVLKDAILGKPRDRQDAIAMLRRMSGQTHRVYTGFTVLQLPEQQRVEAVECTEVTFKPLSDEEIEAYVDTGSPMDKAGAYGIQDTSAIFIERIHGCFYNVVGFPLARFYETCKAKFFKGN